MFISRRLTACLAATLLSACSASKTADEPATQPEPAPTPTVALEAANCDELRTSVVGSLTEAVLHARYGGIQIDDKLGGKGDEVDDSAEEEEIELESEPPLIEAEDLLKVAGDRLFALSDAKLDIVHLGEDGTLETMGYFGIGDGASAVGMFADDEFAVLIHEVSDESDAEFPSTRVTVLDVADASSPELVQQFDIEGEFEMARRQGDDIRVVTSARWRVERDVWEIAYGDSAVLPAPDPNGDEIRQEQLRADARPLVRELVEERLPAMEELIPRLVTDDSGPLLECDAIFTSANRASVRVTTLTEFSASRGPESFGVVGNSFAGAIQGTTLHAAFSARWGARAGRSDLHAFDFADGYVGSVGLGGTLVDEYSVSATDDEVHLITVSDGAELVTIEFDSKFAEPELAALTDDKLVVANRITSRAAYVATGGDADRIFALPLGGSEATGPYEVGGVPSMIHALDEDRILVVAQQNNDEGQQVGVRVEVFDSDAEPQSSAEISTGEFAAWSEAMWEPRSLAYGGDGLVAFPVNIEAWGEAGGANFSGVLLYDAGDDISRRGEIDHTDLRSTRWCRQNDQEDDCEAPQSSPWWTHVRRSAFVGGRIVTVSDAGMKVHDLESLEELGRIVFE